MSEWHPDVLGEGYEQQTFDLGADPDREGQIEAVLVRRAVRPEESVKSVVLYVHGFSDYFFQTELADRLAEQGHAFYALDLRKSGRARRPGQTAHYISDLAMYDEELERSMAVIEAERPGLGVTVIAHSTGGLIAPLWLDRRRKEGRTAPVTGLVLNSPWFDLQGSKLQRGPMTWALRGAARFAPLRALGLPESSVYGDSLHATKFGEWEFDVDLKPLGGFPVTVGWLNAIRRGHARLHRGLDVGVRSLVLRSDKTHYARERSDATDRADTVLDVRQIARWAGSLGQQTAVVVIPDARHDVFLSLSEPRAAAYAALEEWLQG